jgi:hypothetical protein
MGSAGHFTLKELDHIKDHYKNSLASVTSDKNVKVHDLVR